MDPLTKSYPWYTPYQFAGNKPIAFVDVDGLEEFPATDDDWIAGLGEGQEGGSIVGGQNGTVKKYMNLSIDGISYIFGQVGGIFATVHDGVSSFVADQVRTVLPTKDSYNDLPDGSAPDLTESEFYASIANEQVAIYNATPGMVGEITAYAVEFAASEVTGQALSGLKKSKGRRINIYGEGESVGFKDFAVNPDYSVGSNGIKRPLTHKLPAASAEEIIINNSPLFEPELKEIGRLSKPGTKITISGPEKSPSFKKLKDYLGDNAKVISSSVESKAFEGYSTEIKTVTLEVK